MRMHALGDGQWPGRTVSERSEPKPCAPHVTGKELLEAATGIEPVYRDLQSSACGHRRTPTDEKCWSPRCVEHHRAEANVSGRAIHAPWNGLATPRRGRYKSPLTTSLYNA